MPRISLSRPIALNSARGLALFCAMLAAGQARAQLVPPAADPLTPKLQTDPRNPPNFQKSNRAPYAQAPGSAVFAPAPAPLISGAGSTGYNSRNTRKPPARTTSTARTPGAASQATVTPSTPALLPSEAQRQQQQQQGTQPPRATAAQQRQAAITGQNALAQVPPRDTTQIGPIRRPPPKRRSFVEEDPYAPLGLRTGSFELFPAVTLSGGYDTNPGRVANGKGSSLFTVAPELRAQSQWSRHELKADLRGSYTGYGSDQTPSLSRPFVNSRVDGRIDVTRETRIDLGGRVYLGTDNPGSPNLPVGLSKLPLSTTLGATAGLGQRFNRFDVSVKGDTQRTVYQNSQLTDGSSYNNDDRNYNQNTVTLRGGYELSPGINPFVQVGFDNRKHDLETDRFGYRRNSDGVTGKVGSTFELSRLLTGEASIGYTQRKYDDTRLSNLSGLIGDASLIWTASALTTVKLTAISSVGESTVPGVSGVLYRDVMFQVDHAFRRHLIGSLKLGYGNDTYKGLSTGQTTTFNAVCNCVTVVSTSTTPGSDRQDQRYSAGAALTYKFDRTTQVTGEFKQTWLRSNVTGVDYTSSLFLVGLRWQK